MSLFVNIASVTPNLARILPPLLRRTASKVIVTPETLPAVQPLIQEHAPTVPVCLQLGTYSAEKPLYEGSYQITEDTYHCLHREYLSKEVSAFLDAFRSTPQREVSVSNPEDLLVALQAGPGLDAARAADMLKEHLAQAWSVLDGYVADSGLSGYALSSESLVADDEKEGELALTDVPMSLLWASLPHGRRSLAWVEAPLNVLERRRLPLVHQQSSGARVAFGAKRPLVALHDNIMYSFFDVPAAASSYSQIYQHLVDYFTPSAEVEDADTLEACAWMRDFLKIMDDRKAQYFSPQQFDIDFVSRISPTMDEQLSTIDEQSLALLSQFFQVYRWDIAHRNFARGVELVNTAYSDGTLPGASDTSASDTPVASAAIQWLLNTGVHHITFDLGLHEDQSYLLKHSSGH